MTTKKNSKKLSFPKFKKKIQDFVKDESWNLTTKGAATVWVAWAAMLWVNEVLGACDISPSGHFNGNTNWHYNWTWTFGAEVKNVPDGSCNWTNTSYNYNHGCSTLTCDDISWVVNWHYNITPNCSTSVLSSHCNHVSSWSWSWDGWGWCGDGWDSCG